MSANKLEDQTGAGDLATVVIGSEEKQRQAAEHGWKKGGTYNYASITAATHDERDKAAAEQLRADMEELRLSHPNAFVAEVPLWAHGAAKYEWKDEYGDVGPRSAELEKALYEDSFISRVGHNFHTYVLLDHRSCHCP